MTRMKNLTNEDVFEMEFGAGLVYQDLKEEEENPKPKERKRVKVAEVSVIKKCPICGTLRALRETDVCSSCLELPITEIDF